jgi:hypothetical protein
MAAQVPSSSASPAASRQLTEDLEVSLADSMAASVEAVEGDDPPPPPTAEKDGLRPPRGAGLRFTGDIHEDADKAYKPPARRARQPPPADAGQAMPPLTLQHFSYSCPGLTGPGAHSDIAMKDFGHETLLSRPQPLVIPLFQRRYCWEADQAERWFRDTIKPAACGGPSDKHGVGKIVVKERDGALWILDGQQRLTTSSLMLAAIRDAALGELRSDDADDADRAALNATVDGCNEHLFLDAPAFEAWAVAQSKAIRASGSTSADAAWQAALDGRAAAYEALPHTRLVPSLSDRRPFSELVGAGMVSAALGTAHPALAVSAETEASAMGQMKRRFTNAIATWLMAFEGSAVPAQLSSLLTRTLRHMYVVMVDVKSDVNLALVFLWMQEKTLFGMGVLLENPSPGKVFHAADLTRNLFLAPFMDDAPEAQERRYRELWLEPFERRLARPGEPNERRLVRMDACIGLYLENRTAAAAAAQHPPSPLPKVHVSAFEKQAADTIQAFEAMDATPHDYTGIKAYTRLYSLYEARCAKWRQEHADATAAVAITEPCPEAEAAVALEILSEICQVAAAKAGQD